MSMIYRKVKKLNKAIDDNRGFNDWLMEYRYFLIEADYENADLRLIDHHFKERMRCKGNQYFKATRMHEYRKLALS